MNVGLRILNRDVLQKIGSSVGTFLNCYARSVKYDEQSSIGLKNENNFFLIRVHFQSGGSHLKKI